MNRSSRKPAIAVCGSGESSGTICPEVEEMARELGRGIVEAGCVLVCGGLGGVMAVAAEGGAQARAAGASGLVLGILPGDDLEGSNGHCDVVVPTGVGVARNVLVVRSGDVVVLVAGGAGTLSEAAIAWELGKPLVALDRSGGWAERLAGGRIDDRRARPVAAARDSQQALALALEAIGIRK